MDTESPIGETAAIGEDYVNVGWLNMEVSFWNPLTMQMVEDYVVANLMYSALFTYDQNWGGPVGDLALEWDVEPQANGSMSTYIRITDHAYFRDIDSLDDTSRKLTADDVKWTFDLIMANTGYTFDWYLRDIWAINVLSETELEINTTYTKATLIDDLCGIPILCEEYWSTLSNPMAKNMRGDQQLGSGPFVYEDEVGGSWYAFKKAPNYFGEDEYGDARTVKVPGILYEVYTDVNAIALDLNDGNLDCVNLQGDVTTYSETLGVGADVEVLKFAVSEPGICDIAINGIPEYFDTPTYYGGNPVLRDPAVRKAIMMTLNKTYINEVLLEGLSIQADSVVQPSEWHADITELPFDPYGARDVLIAAGYSADSDGDDLLEATASAYAVQQGWVSVGFELSGIRCEAPDTDPNYYAIATAWVGEALKAGIGLSAARKSEGVMTNIAWFKSDYDIWVWHWGWGPEPIGAALTCWLTEEIKEGGYNCQGPMGEWWVHGALNNYEENYSTCPYVNASMIAEFGMEDEDFIGFSSFDQNISTALKTVDKAARMEITDELQQVIYDSYCENPPYYDTGLYGVTTARFTNWGNWSAHNGLPMTAGLLWLWFQLETADNLPPSFTSGLQDNYQAIVGQVFEVTVEAVDEDGDPIMLNCTWGDGSDPDRITLSGDTSEPQQHTFTHTYEELDTGLELRITAWDGLPRHQVATSALVDVLAELDYGPVFAPGSPSGTPTSPVYIDTVVTWTATVSDVETDVDDEIKFTWDWDDDTYDVAYHSPTVLGGQVTDTQTHSWSYADDFDVTVYVWDGYNDDESNAMHNVSTTVTYRVLENTQPHHLQISEIQWVPSSWAPIVGSAIDDDPDALTFTWEWDDGTFNVTQVTNTNPGSIVYDTVSHMWDTEDTYSVTLWVDDGKEHNVSTTVTATIATDVAPTALMLVQDPDPGHVEAEVAFTASAYDGNSDALTFTLNFGDGEIAVETTAGGTMDVQEVDFTHTYYSEGPYSVTMFVDDGTVGHNISQTFNVRVIDNEAPTISLQSSLTAKYNVTFTVAPTEVSDPDGDTVTVWFDWGDSSPMSMGDADNFYTGTHVYSILGEVTLTAWADDGMGNNASDTMTVTITQNLQATVNMVRSPVATEYLVGAVITFNVTISDTEGDNVTVRIVFGDGASNVTVVDTTKGVSTTLTFTHEYDEAGAYTVVASAADDQDHFNPAPATKSVTFTVVEEQAESNWALIAGIGLVIVIALLAILMLMKRKKKGVESPGAEGMEGMEGMRPPEENPPEPPPGN
jgi:ABC-type transport system substrate-binding protein